MNARIFGLMLLVALALAGCTPAMAPAPPATLVPTRSAAASVTPRTTPVARPAGSAAALLGVEVRERYRSMEPLDLAQQAGAHWVRLPLRWSLLEPELSDPPDYFWVRYDKSLAEMRARGFQIVLTLRDNPEWAAKTRCGPLHESGKAEYTRMLTDVVTRYSRPPYDIHHWEIYNEPDNADARRYASLGGCYGDQPATYAEMLQLAYGAIKAVDPQAVVLFGGLALEKFSGSPFNITFVEQVLEAGGGDYFDWMNFHYYPAFSYRWEKFGSGVEGKANYLRQVMQAAGVEKPVACSEIGQPSEGPKSEGYSDAKSMAEIFRGFAQAFAADVEFAIWFALQDDATDPRHYGLLTSAGEPKPAFATFELLSRLLADAQFAGRLSEAESGSARLEVYRFNLDAGDYDTLLIAWRNDDGPALPLAVPATEALLTDTDGQDTPVVDGAPADLDPATGRLSIGIGPEPVIIRY